MSYVGEPFEHDVFVSYGRANREPGEASPQRAWSLAFASQLGAYLRGPRRFYEPPQRKLRVFLDESEDGLHGMGPLTPQIHEAAASSAVLLILMSDDYLASDWCRQELEAWHDRSRELGLDVDYRIAVARIQPTEEDHWDKRLRDFKGRGLPGYWFHRQPRNSRETVLPFGSPRPDPSVDGPLQEPFFKLVQDVQAVLDELRKQFEERERQRQQAARLGQPEPTLYLHGGADRIPDWNTLRAALSGSGFAMVPSSIDDEARDPEGELQLHKARLKAMENCDALLAMSTANRASTDADLLFIGRQVRHELRARNVPHKPCALLNAVVQQAATANLRDLAGKLDVQWIDSIHSNWVSDVHAWLGAAGRKDGTPR